ncbi:MAG: carbohydrate-binding protein [Gemmatimonadetes bacterium]|nr:carbohydrate-binding protein [Gemmatimonadota bacterium]
MTRLVSTWIFLVLLGAGCGVMPRSGAPRATTPFGGVAQFIPGVVEAEHYDLGPAGVAYYDVDERNQGANYRELTQVDIEARKDASNGHGIGWAVGGEWLNYTVEVRESGTYTVEVPVASRRKGGTFHLEFDGTDVTGPFDVPDTGSWQTLQTIRKENVPLRKGTYTMRLVLDASGPSGAVADIDLIRFIRVR